ncbi:hypothetical protein [Burkholderia cepacia]|uniref:hypothetical protein n=1 Tax=Burkholderia cepacia TaxID=292 RepID=UPI0012D89A46|nr:hypothetical protein [Burkholderia cepacia]
MPAPPLTCKIGLRQRTHVLGCFRILDPKAIVFGRQIPAKLVAMLIEPREPLYTISMRMPGSLKLLAIRKSEQG